MSDVFLEQFFAPLLRFTLEQSNMDRKLFRWHLIPCINNVFCVIDFFPFSRALLLLTLFDVEKVIYNTQWSSVKLLEVLSAFQQLNLTLSVVLSLVFTSQGFTIISSSFWTEIKRFDHLKKSPFQLCILFWKIFI